MKDSATRTAEVLGGRKEGGGRARNREEFAELEPEEWREVRRAGQQEREQSLQPLHSPQWGLMPTPYRMAVGPGQGRERCAARTQAGFSPARSQAGASSRGHCRLLFPILKCRHLGDLERNPNPSHTQAKEEKVVGDLAQLVCAKGQS